MKKRALKGSFNQTLAPLLFLAPNLFIFGVFIVLPAVLGLRMAFYDWGVLSTPVFAGFKNFLLLFKDEMFWTTLGNTFVYVAFTVPLLMAAALGLALLLKDEGKGIGVFRSFYYIPATLSLIMVGIAWRWLMGEEMGILNYLLKVSGFAPVHWLTEGAMAMGSLIFVTLWAGAGFYMVMFIGGLQAIPQDLYEAAHIDGARKNQVFFRVTLPLLKPTLLVAFVLATINSFKAFELIYVLTEGGPGSATKFLVQQVYQVAFQEDKMGYASAMSVVLLLIIGVLTLLQFKLTGKEYANE